MPAADAFDLGPAPTRIAVTEELAQRLVSAQFPRWAPLPVEPVADGGWDNWTFTLGSTMVVRLPSAAEYAQAVEKEHPTRGPSTRGSTACPRPRTGSPTTSSSPAAWPTS